MDRIEIRGGKVLKGSFSPPPDKSISHRAVFFTSLAKGRSVIRNFLAAEDPLSTVNAFRALGVAIEERPAPRQRGRNLSASRELTVDSKGLRGLTEPTDVINCGNSGTTMRLVSGVLSGNPFFSVLTGDGSLRTRPMARVIKPLTLMGADIMARADNRFPPLAIRGGKLTPITYEMPVASAQVKSSVILAGLFADGETVVVERAKSRDHTERMLPSFGADLEVEGLRVKVRGGGELAPADIEVPADFSSAAFFIVAAMILPGSEITAMSVGVNPTRTGLLNVLLKMGGGIELSNMRDVSGEPVADIRCTGGAGLKPVEVTGDEVPSLIDEFPILCVAAACAEGVTTIRGAEELRVKESDRIKAMASELRKMGVEVEEYPDGLSIRGTGGLLGAEIESYGDHRIAMAMAIAGLAARGTTTVRGASAVDISFPRFFDIINTLAV